MERTDAGLDALEQQAVALCRTGDFDAAEAAFSRILTQDPERFVAATTLSALRHRANDLEAARRLLVDAVRRRPWSLTEPFDPERPTILRALGVQNAFFGLVELDDGTWRSGLRRGHFALRDLLPAGKYNVVELHVLEDNLNELDDLPAFDLVINSIACPDRERDSLEALARFLDRHPGTAVVNDPRRVLETARDTNHARLDPIPGVRFPKTVRFAWNGDSPRAVAERLRGLGFSFPLILRDVGTQTGVSMVQVASQEELGARLGAAPARELYAIQFEDSAFRPGYHDKLRMLCVEGTWYPVAHLIDREWNIHDASRAHLMLDEAWTREEEQRFLEDAPGILGAANVEKLRAIEEIVGLDYFGIDFTVTKDGTLIVFEANPAMRHNFESAELCPYTRPYLARISRAFAAMVDRRAAG